MTRHDISDLAQALGHILRRDLRVGAASIICRLLKDEPKFDPDQFRRAVEAQAKPLQADDIAR